MVRVSEFAVRTRIGTMDMDVDSGSGSDSDEWTFDDLSDDAIWLIILHTRKWDRIWLRDVNTRTFEFIVQLCPDSGNRRNHPHENDRLSPDIPDLNQLQDLALWRAIAAAALSGKLGIVDAMRRHKQWCYDNAILSSNRDGLSYRAVDRIGTKMRQVAVVYAAAGDHRQLLHLLYKASASVGWNPYHFQECMIEGYVTGGHADRIFNRYPWVAFIPLPHLQEAHRKAVHSRQPVVARRIAELIRQR